MKIKFGTLEKELLKQYLPEILTETKKIAYFTWKAEDYLLDMPMKWITSRVIYIDDNLAGVSINSAKGSNLHIHIFLIFDANRHNKIGNQLLADVIETANLYNLSKITLKCSADNVPALVFYLRNDFRINDFDIVKNLLSLKKCLTVTKA